MKTFRKFFIKKQKTIARAQGVYLYLKGIGKVVDFTSGWTGYASLGHNNQEIIKAIKLQSQKFTHIDYNEFLDPNIEKLSNELVKFNNKDLNRVWYSGSSGSESTEAALKLSFQMHLAERSKKKTKFIYRNQSFHGSTLHPILVSDLDILNKFKILGNNKYLKVTQHNPYAICYAKKNKCDCGKNPKDCMGKYKNETNEEYLTRSIEEIENTIKKNNPDTICAFIGETQLGSLVGDVPALKGYWKSVSKICKKYNIHLILDEVYCGFGRTGKMYAYQWEDISPDFVCLGKNMTSGVIPLSAVLTKSKFEKKIIKELGRVSLGHTFQGHSLGIAACIKLVEIIKRDNLLKKITNNGNYMRKILFSELNNNEFYSNIRGRGYSFALEHKTNNNSNFTKKLYETMLYKHKILINTKFHRTSFLPIYITKMNTINMMLEKFIKTFKDISKKKL